jgi:hypothetical protein
VVKGLTRAEIMKALPNLKKGSFDKFMALAGIKKIGEKPTERPHIKAYIYPGNSIEILRNLFEKKEK